MGIFVNSQQDTIALAFRGTEGAWDWANNFLASSASCKYVITGGCNGGAVHRGFSKVLNLLRSTYHAALQQLITGTTTTVKNIYVVGHSKGGALATLASLDLARKFPRYASTIRTITFGSPKVGDGAFVDAFNQAIGGRSTRYVTTSLVTGDDAVTNVPLRGYRHVEGRKYLACPFYSEKRTSLVCHLISQYAKALVIDGQAGQTDPPSYDVSTGSSCTTWLAGF